MGDFIGRASGHFGELAQGRLGARGPIALVTLPAPSVETVARFRPSAGPGPLLGVGAAGSIARRAARTALARFGRGGRGGRLFISTNAPVGAGLGGSTMAALAAIRAVAAFARAGLDPAIEARLAAEAEAAVDPLMLPEPGRALWASRGPHLLALGAPPPPLRVVGVVLGPGAPTADADMRFAPVDDLATALFDAFARGDVAAIGAAATVSARRRAEIAPLPRWEEMTALADAAGAAGIARAHTGSSVAFLFDPAHAARAEALAARLMRDARVSPFQFRTDGRPV